MDRPPPVSAQTEAPPDQPRGVTVSSCRWQSLQKAKVRLRAHPPRTPGRSRLWVTRPEYGHPGYAGIRKLNLPRERTPNRTSTLAASVLDASPPPGRGAGGPRDSLESMLPTSMGWRHTSGRVCPGYLIIPNGAARQKASWISHVWPGHAPSCHHAGDSTHRHAIPKSSG